MDVIAAVEESNGRKNPTLLAAAKGSLTDVERAYLVDCCHDDDPTRVCAGSFMIRRLLELENARGLDVARAFSALKRELPWPAIFHLLQSFRYAPALGLPHEKIVRTTLDSERTALRVVALDAFVHLATINAQLLSEAQERIFVAGQDAKPSLRARARFLAGVLAANAA